ncbi:MAG: phosphatidylglycerol:prolipoprotein diacylglycerol transferase [Alphaproteobacteria bacterium]|jgi:phosphatidylglycerol:prolipoprotein diacylglycerol transferase
MPFPDIDPVAIAIGPLVIRWYALAFIFGLLAGWGYIGLFLRQPPHIMTRAQLSDFFSWAIVGVIVGGRLGYVSFYQAPYYFENPIEVFFVWQGGMSFHGGLIGVVVAIILFARRQKIPMFALGDLVACAAPIGLFFGRLANFINGELYGRVADVPWAMVFPGGGDLPRHPSQLYEAALEGVILFIVMFVLVRFTKARTRPGLMMGVFMIGYGLARIIVELFREPDVQIGFLASGTTLGQWLSVPLLVAGSYFIYRAISQGPLDRRPSPTPAGE